MLGIAFAAASIATGDAMHLAYVDPGTGSFLLQALVAGLAGAAVAINVYWKKIKAFLGMSAAESADTKKPDDDSPDS